MNTVDLDRVGAGKVVELIVAVFERVEILNCQLSERLSAICRSGR